MQRPKAFFYVCVGILALALAFHLGASNARSQSASPLLTALTWGDQPSCTTLFGVDSQGGFWVNCGLGNSWVKKGQLPGPAVSVFPFPPAGVIFVGLANGDVYTTPISNLGVFKFESNVFSGAPVSALHETWGHIKADRR